MKITYIHQYFTTPSMSGGTRSYEMAKRMVQAGHSVHMITSDRTQAGKPYTTIEAGIEVTWIPVKYSNHLSPFARTMAFVNFALRSARIAARSEADVVFATSTPLTVALPALYAKWRQRIPMIFEVRDLWPALPIAMGVLRDPVSKFLARGLERLAYRHSSLVVALSPGMKDGVVATGFPAENVIVVPNSCDVDMFAVDASEGFRFRESLPWLRDRPLVTYAGTIGEINGIPYMVDLAAETLLLDPEVCFLLVGNGKQEEVIRQYAHERGVLNKNFFMIPSVPKREMPSVLSASDICLSLFIDLQEMWANSANKFFDAFAAGRPVAINYGGWQASLLHNTSAGLVLSPTDIRLSAISIVKALHDKTWLASAATNARKLALERFDRNALAQDLIEAMESVVPSAPLSGKKGTGHEL